MDLEKYLIAEEGLITSNYAEENINRLKNKDTALYLFTTDTNMIYGGLKNIDNYRIKYGFDKLRYFMIDKYVQYLLRREIKLTEITNDPLLIAKLDKKFKNIDIRKNNTIVTNITKICNLYVKETNNLLIVIFKNPIMYSVPAIREYPVIVANVSMLKSIGNGIFYHKPLFETIQNTIQSNNKFSIMNPEIPKQMIIYGKNFKFDLFHVSPVGDITKLTPRKTSKPLKNENVRIARVSAAPTIDACFRAVGFSLKDDKPIKYYVYQLNIQPNTRIVKPTTKLVPDVEETSEYWVLDEVGVTKLGYITISYNKKINRYEFDNSKMKVDPMVTSEFGK